MDALLCIFGFFVLFTVGTDAILFFFGNIYFNMSPFTFFIRFCCLITHYVCLLECGFNTFFHFHTIFHFYLREIYDIKQ